MSFPIYLNGWQRIGVVASVIWIALVAAYAFYEISEGPFGTRFLTDLVYSNGEPVRVLKGGLFDDIGLHAKLDAAKICVAAIVPVASLLLAGWTVVWIARGFRRRV